MSGLYIHIPWCIRKCPYCDFNSHEKRGDFDETTYVDRLIEDLKIELNSDVGTIDTVYFGGGTPSLFGPDSFARILDRSVLKLCNEVTMEANPGTTEHLDFHLYKNAGITRLSLGVQSFDASHLETLGRIHGPDEARRATERALDAGFDSVNLDLMHSLPHQSMDQALKDLEIAIALRPTHVSWYELTIEPNTVFAKSPPSLPSNDFREELEKAGIALLADHGYRRYEVSAFARDGLECRHNLNYWHFGDYVGIGAGAHGKKTTSEGIFRTAKVRTPKSYLNEVSGSCELIRKEDLPVEFMMNALRLVDGVSQDMFSMKTGLPFESIAKDIDRLRDWRLMHPDRLQLTSDGFQQLNGVVAQFLHT